MFFREGWRLLLEFRSSSWRYQRTFIPKYIDNVFYKQNNFIFKFFAFGHKKLVLDPDLDSPKGLIRITTLSLYTVTITNKKELFNSVQMIELYFNLYLSLSGQVNPTRQCFSYIHETYM